MLDRKPFNIAIDGYAACGKSTLAGDVGASLGFAHLDTGLMYRAVSYYYLQLEIDFADFQSKIHEHLSDVDLDVSVEHGTTDIFLDKHKITSKLRSPEIDAVVSDIAAVKEIRKKLVSIQQSLALTGNVILDGRDIGTQVLPDAQLKIFLIADIEIRAKRRQMDLKEAGINKSLTWVTEQLKQRDFKDINRKESPLKKAPDAVVVDNTNLNRDEQLKIICALVECRM